MLAKADIIILGLQEPTRAQSESKRTRNSLVA